MQSMPKLKDHYTMETELTTIKNNNTGPGFLHSWLSLNFWDETTAMQHKHFQKIKENGTLLNSFQETSVTWIPV